MPGLQTEGLSRERLITLLTNYAQLAVARGAGPSQIRPTREHLESILDQLLEEGMLKPIGDNGDDVVYQWREADRSLLETTPRTSP